MFGSRNFLFAKSSADPGNILFMWGYNNRGQTALIPLGSRSSPVQVGASNTWTQISTGQGSTLAVNSLGELWSWGYNNEGQLGQNDTVNRSSPVQIGALTNWAIPVSSYKWSMCLKTDATLWSWGFNGSGQLGHGSIGTSRSSPVQVGSNWAAIAAGTNSRTALAVKTNGQLWAWGYGYSGALGNEIALNQSSPIQVGALTNWKTPTTQNSTSACVKTDGTLWTWGVNGSGQLGQNDTLGARSSPVQVGSLTNWATPNSGGSYPGMACVKTDGTLFTWGQNGVGQLGLGDTISRSSPVQVGALTNWAIPRLGKRSTMCLKTDGTLWTWGNNSQGQLGIGTAYGTNRSSPVQIGALDTWSSLSSGNDTSGAIREGPKIAPANVSVPVISGIAEDGETLTSTTGTWNNEPSSFAFQWQRGTSNIGGATSSTYAIQAGDVGSTLRCVVTATNAIGAAVANSANTAVVTVTGKKLYGWGSSGQSQFGIPGYVARSSPVFVGGSAWENLAVARHGGLCNKTDGTLWSWGTGAYGQPGQGNTSNRSFPQQIGALTNWSKPSIGGAEFRNAGPVACVKTNGTLFTWGYNPNGQLGLGDTNNRSSPVQVGALTTWANVSMGFDACQGVTTSGTLFGWGYGRTNAASNYGLASPNQVGALTNWSKPQVFRNHALNVKTDNTLWANGQNNSFGQFGNNTTTYSASPIQIGGAVWATAIVGGSVLQFSACIRTDGTLWTWGKNDYGQLGINNTTNRSSPVQVGGLTTWSKVVGGLAIMGATKTDGTLWAWGKNDYGQLGLGDLTNRSSPVQVGALTNWANPAFGVNFAMCTTT
jgi:alpha-tubulin suppressor-like RCC1 family protein